MVPCDPRSKIIIEPVHAESVRTQRLFDLKQVASSTLRNTKVDTQGKQVKWVQIVWIRCAKSEEDSIFFKYRMTEDFKKLKIKGNSRQKKTLASCQELPKRYDTRQAISEAKKGDLLDLCDPGIVPKKHHHYYHSIPSSSSVSDRLPEPESTDTDDE